MNKPAGRRRLLVESVILAALLVGMAFLVLLGEPSNPDFGVRAILAAGFGLPLLLLKHAAPSGPAVISTPLLLAMWSIHFVLLVSVFYGAGTAYERWKQWRKHARA